MPTNLDFTIKRGDAGKVMTATLTNDDGAVDLTGYTVTVTAKQGTSAPVLDDEPATVTDDVNGIIQFTFDDITSDIEPGEYDLEFTATLGATQLTFPTNKRHPYGILRVQRPL